MTMQRRAHHHQRALRRARDCITFHVERIEPPKQCVEETGKLKICATTELISNEVEFEIPSMPPPQISSLPKPQLLFMDAPTEAKLDPEVSILRFPVNPTLAQMDTLAGEEERVLELSKLREKTFPLQETVLTDAANFNIEPVYAPRPELPALPPSEYVDTKPPAAWQTEKRLFTIPLPFMPPDPQGPSMEPPALKTQWPRDGDNDAVTLRETDETRIIQVPLAYKVERMTIEEPRLPAPKLSQRLPYCPSEVSLLVRLIQNLRKKRTAAAWDAFRKPVNPVIEWQQGPFLRFMLFLRSTLNELWRPIAEKYAQPVELPRVVTIAHQESNDAQTVLTLAVLRELFASMESGGLSLGLLTLDAAMQHLPLKAFRGNKKLRLVLQRLHEDVVKHRARPQQPVGNVRAPLVCRFMQCTGCFPPYRYEGPKVQYIAEAHLERLVYVPSVQLRKHLALTNAAIQLRPSDPSSFTFTLQPEVTHVRGFPHSQALTPLVMAPLPESETEVSAKPEIHPILVGPHFPQAVRDILESQGVTCITKKTMGCPSVAALLGPSHACVMIDEHNTLIPFRFDKVLALSWEALPPQKIAELRRHAQTAVLCVHSAQDAADAILSALSPVPVDFTNVQHENASGAEEFLALCTDAYHASCVENPNRRSLLNEYGRLAEKDEFTVAGMMCFAQCVKDATSHNIAPAYQRAYLPAPPPLSISLPPLAPEAPLERLEWAAEDHDSGGKGSTFLEPLSVLVDFWTKVPSEPSSHDSPAQCADIVKLSEDAPTQMSPSSHRSLTGTPSRPQATVASTPSAVDGCMVTRWWKEHDVSGCPKTRAGSAFICAQAGSTPRQQSLKTESNYCASDGQGGTTGKDVNMCRKKGALTAGRRVHASGTVWPTRDDMAEHGELSDAMEARREGDTGVADTCAQGTCRAHVCTTDMVTEETGVIAASGGHQKSCGRPATSHTPTHVRAGIVARAARPRDTCRRSAHTAVDESVLTLPRAHGTFSTVDRFSFAANDSQDAASTKVHIVSDDGNACTPKRADAPAMDFSMEPEGIEKGDARDGDMMELEFSCAQYESEHVDDKQRGTMELEFLCAHYEQNNLLAQQVNTAAMEFYCSGNNDKPLDSKQADAAVPAVPFARDEGTNVEKPLLSFVRRGGENVDAKQVDGAVLRLSIASPDKTNLNSDTYLCTDVIGHTSRRIAGAVDDKQRVNDKSGRRGAIPLMMDAANLATKSGATESATSEIRDEPEEKDDAGTTMMEKTEQWYNGVDSNNSALDGVQDVLSLSPDCICHKDAGKSRELDAEDIGIPAQGPSSSQCGTPRTTEQPGHDKDADTSVQNGASSRDARNERGTGAFPDQYWDQKEGTWWSETYWNARPSEYDRFAITRWPDEWDNGWREHAYGQYQGYQSTLQGSTTSHQTFPSWCGTNVQQEQGSDNHCNKCDLSTRTNPWLDTAAVRKDEAALENDVHVEDVSLRVNKNQSCEQSAGSEEDGDSVVKDPPKGPQTDVIHRVAKEYDATCGVPSVRLSKCQKEVECTYKSARNSTAQHEPAGRGAHEKARDDVHQNSTQSECVRHGVNIDGPDNGAVAQNVERTRGHGNAPRYRDLDARDDTHGAHQRTERTRPDRCTPDSRDNNVSARPVVPSARLMARTPSHDCGDTTVSMQLRGATHSGRTRPPFTEGTAEETLAQDGEDRALTNVAARDVDGCGERTECAGQKTSVTSSKCFAGEHEDHSTATEIAALRCVVRPLEVPKACEKVDEGCDRQEVLPCAVAVIERSRCSAHASPARTAPVDAALTELKVDKNCFGTIIECHTMPGFARKAPPSAIDDDTPNNQEHEGAQSSVAKDSIPLSEGRNLESRSSLDTTSTTEDSNGVLAVDPESEQQECLTRTQASALKGTGTAALIDDSNTRSDNNVMPRVSNMESTLRNGIRDGVEHASATGIDADNREISEREGDVDALSIGITAVSAGADKMTPRIHVAASSPRVCVAQCALSRKPSSSTMQQLSASSHNDTAEKMRLPEVRDSTGHLKKSRLHVYAGNAEFNASPPAAHSHSPAGCVLTPTVVLSVRKPRSPRIRQPIDSGVFKLGAVQSYRDVRPESVENRIRTPDVTPESLSRRSKRKRDRSPATDQRHEVPEEYVASPARSRVRAATPIANLTQAQAAGDDRLPDKRLLNHSGIRDEDQFVLTCVPSGSSSLAPSPIVTSPTLLLMDNQGTLPPEPSCAFVPDEALLASEHAAAAAHASSFDDIPGTSVPREYTPGSSRTANQIAWSPMEACVGSTSVEDGCMNWSAFADASPLPSDSPLLSTSQLPCEARRTLRHSSQRNDSSAQCPGRSSHSLVGPDIALRSQTKSGFADPDNRCQASNDNHVNVSSVTERASEKHDALATATAHDPSRKIVKRAGKTQNAIVATTASGSFGKLPASRATDDRHLLPTLVRGERAKGKGANEEARTMWRGGKSALMSAMIKGAILRAHSKGGHCKKGNQKGMRGRGTFESSGVACSSKGVVTTHKSGPPPFEAPTGVGAPLPKCPTRDAEHGEKNQHDAPDGVRVVDTDYRDRESASQLGPDKPKIRPQPLGLSHRVSMNEALAPTGPSSRTAAAETAFSGGPQQRAHSRQRMAANTCSDPESSEKGEVGQPLGVFSGSISHSGSPCMAVYSSPLTGKGRFTRAPGLPGAMNPPAVAHRPRDNGSCQQSPRKNATQHINDKNTRHASLKRSYEPSPHPSVVVHHRSPRSPLANVRSRSPRASEVQRTSPVACVTLPFHARAFTTAITPHAPGCVTVMSPPVGSTPHKVLDLSAAMAHRVLHSPRAISPRVESTRNDTLNLSAAMGPRSFDVSPSPSPQTASGPRDVPDVSPAASPCLSNLSAAMAPRSFDVSPSPSPQTAAVPRDVPHVLLAASPRASDLSAAMAPRSFDISPSPSPQTASGPCDVLDVSPAPSPCASNLSAAMAPRSFDLSPFPSQQTASRPRDVPNVSPAAYPCASNLSAAMASRSFDLSPFMSQQTASGPCDVPDVLPAASPRASDLSAAMAPRSFDISPSPSPQTVSGSRDVPDILPAASPRVSDLSASMNARFLSVSPDTSSPVENLPCNIRDLSAAIAANGFDSSAAMSPPPHACFQVSSPFSSPHTTDFSTRLNEVRDPQKSRDVCAQGREHNRQPLCYAPNDERDAPLQPDITPSYFDSEYLPQERVCYSKRESVCESSGAHEGHGAWGKNRVSNYERYNAVAELSPKRDFGCHAPRDNRRPMDCHTPNRAGHSPSGRHSPRGNRLTVGHHPPNRERRSPRNNRRTIACHSPNRICHSALNRYPRRDNRRSVGRHSPNCERRSPLARAQHVDNAPTYDRDVLAQEARWTMADRERDAFAPNARAASHHGNRNHKEVAHEGRPRTARASSTQHSPFGAPSYYTTAQHPAPPNFSSRRASDDNQHARPPPCHAPPDRRAARQTAAAPDRDFHALPRHHEQQMRHKRQNSPRRLAAARGDEAAPKAPRQGHALFSPGRVASPKAGYSQHRQHIKQPAAQNQWGAKGGGELNGDHRQSGHDGKKSVSQPVDGQRVESRTAHQHKPVAIVQYPQRQNKGRKRWGARPGAGGIGEPRARGTCTLIHNPE